MHHRTEARPLRRPTLPPMLYAIFLPHVGAYVRGVDEAGELRTTASQSRAWVLPEPSARAEAADLIHETGFTVELRPVEIGARTEGAPHAS